LLADFGFCAADGIEAGAVIIFGASISAGPLDA